MALSPTEVEKIAHLAKLKFAVDELPALTEKLSTIVDMVAQMENVDTAQVEPVSHPLDLHQRLREDVVTVPNLRKSLQSIAPEVLAGLYLVPIVIE